MLDWLSTETSELETSVSTLILRLLLAWLGGFLVALLAGRRQPPEIKGTLTITLVLMCILIAMATQIIGNNVARAFSLVGALSIVRFRTAVPATRDVAFVLAAVVLGMAIGAGQYWVAGLGLVVLGLASSLETKPAERDGNENPGAASPQTLRLTLQVSLNAINGWTRELENNSESYELVSAETARKGSSLELIYRLKLRSTSDTILLLSQLNVLPGVEFVSLKQATNNV